MATHRHRLLAALLALLVSGTAGAAVAVGASGPAQAAAADATAVDAAGVGAPGPGDTAAADATAVGAAGVERAVATDPRRAGARATGPAVEPTGAAPVASAGTGGPARQRAEPCDLDAIYDREIDSVVTIRTFDERGDLGQGSGWVYRVNDSTALVVTNWHVVADARGADVQFARGEWRSAEALLGDDPYSDLAVIRVEDPPGYVDEVTLSDRAPDEGDGVVALGAPLGLEGSVTSGIVSAVDRAVTVGRDGTVYTVPNAIQTDAAINPGNSGGPLLNCDGEVVGVNFAGVSPTTGANVNFAVAASTVRKVVPSLVENGSYDHAYLGVRVRTLTPTLAQVNGLDEDVGGVLVESVVPGGPAAGTLRGSPFTDRVTGFPLGGDAVVAVDGTEIDDVAALRDYLFDETRPGEEVTLTVLRNGERVEVTVELGAKPEPPARPGAEGTTL